AVEGPGLNPDRRPIDPELRHAVIEQHPMMLVLRLDQLRVHVPRASLVRLRLDQNGRPHRPPPENLVDLLVRYGDAALGPVEITVSCTNPSLSRWQAVNHDVAARGDPERPRARPMCGVRVGNSERAMVAALRVARLDVEQAFRRSLVADTNLVTDRLLAQRHEI